jgi:predicted nucleotide-binding protein
MGKGKKIARPVLLPTASSEEIIELLKVQRAKGEELLKNDSLSPGDLQYWNLFTKEILTKAFGPSREYIESILYAGENKPYSAYEPESNMAKMRRNNIQITLKMLEDCMEWVQHPDPLKPESMGGEEKALPEESPAMPAEPAVVEEKPKESKESVAPAGVTLGEAGPKVENMEKSKDRKILIVPGRDKEKKAALAAFLEKLELEPFIAEGPAEPGASPFADLEQYGEVPFAVILLTGDDYGYPKGSPENAKPRPSQNVVLELGFLMGRLKTEQVCALCEEGLDLPSEFKGRFLIPYDAGGLWKLLIARAMKMAGVDIDLNRAI